VIRRLGSLAGKRVLFGYDRYIASEVEAYRAVLAGHGEVVQAVDHTYLHYLSSAEMVCTAVQNDEDSLGVLCCGTGMGMSIAANKFRGIYAARCTSVEDAELARSINNANVLCVAAKQGLVVNAAIIDAFIRTAYQGRKLEELEHITRLEGESPVSVASALQANRRTA
jgi:ribose 5-phosphate isomerase B